MNDNAHLVYGLLPRRQSFEELAGIISRLISATISFEAGALRDRKVLIKADFSVRQDGRPRTDATMLRAIAGHFVELGAIVLVGDSPLDASLEDCGAEVRERLSLDVGDFPIEFVSFEHAGATPCITDRRVFYVTSCAVEADLLVNVATYRHDTLCENSGCLANLVGLLPGFQKARLLLRGEGRDTFSRLIVDLLGAVSPHLSVLIVPARYGEEEEGVVVGVSTDAVALDASFERRVSGSLVPSDVIRFAADAGLGIGWPEVIGEQALTEIPGDLTYVPEKSDSRISRWPAAVYGMMAPFIWALPRIRSVGCNPECKVCTSSCPTGALEFDDSTRGVVLNAGRCVGCWRCREVCPSDVISIKQSLMATHMLS